MPIETLVRDLKQSLRILRKNPTFSLAAIAALTLGIGANTAIFSVVNAVLLRPMNMPDPDRLVVFMNTSPQGSAPGASPAKFAFWSAQTDVIKDPAALRQGNINYTGGEIPEQLDLAQVSVNFFTLFGAPVAMGRTFRPEEDLPGGERVAVLGHTLWERKFDGDPNIVGRTISLDGEPFTVVGVLGDFPFREFGATPEVFTPFQLDPNTTDQGHYFTAAARLKDGVTLEQAQAKLAASAEQYRAKFPQALQANNAFTVEPVRDVLVRNVRTSLWVLTAAVGFVLLIACANVANLLLARATGRTREIAVRAAIGGSRGRLLRQMLTESVVLASIGGLLGLAVGVLGIRALLSVNTAGLPRVGENGAFVGLDWNVVGFAILLSLGTGLLFGLLPAIQGSRADLTTALKEAAGRSGSGARSGLTRGALVITEVALAVVLLVGSALLIRTAVSLANVDPGFDTSNVVTMRTSLTGPQFATSAGVAQVIRTGVEQLEAIPGVEMATASCCVPLQGGYGLPFVVSGRPLEGQPFHGGGGWNTVSPGYFEVFHIALKRGRTFTDRDNAGGPPAVIINEAMATQFFKDEDPLNARITIGRGVMREFADEPERQIVGVVADTRDGGLNADPQPRMYVPQAQLPDAANALNVRLTPLAWIVRTRANSQALTRQIETELNRATSLPVTSVQAMDEIVSASTSRTRFNMWLMSIFGGVALLLAAIGIYGLMAYSVAQRKQEIGIRLALGAQASSVRNMVIRQGMGLALVGMAVGLGAAFYLSRFIANFLFNVDQRDPVAFAGVPAVLMVVVLVAVAIPAFRASRVDPLTALRHD
ncbi:MAG: ABC transporter permease [Vicinamibacterales bacterium]